MNKKTLIGLLVLVIIIIGGVLVLFHFSYNISSSLTPASKSSLLQNTIPAGTFVKVNDQDYAPPGKVIVVEQSWYGCPVGAAASWAIYNVIKNYGNVSFQFHYSDPDHSPANIPGLIFTGFKSQGELEFYIAYVYNEYLNASYNGTPIPTDQLIPEGEQILTEELETMGVPNATQVASIIIHYEVNVTVSNYGKPAALYVKPPHLNFAILISGPNGTYIVDTPIVNPTTLEGYSPQYIYQNLDTFTQIIQASDMIQNVIAMAYPTGSCPT